MSGTADLNGVVVPGEGPSDAAWAIVGERPGYEEARVRGPFKGKTGKEQDVHLARNGLKRRDGYFTNLVKDYRDGNPDPTPADVDRWGPRLLHELSAIRPRVIFAAGHHATKFLVGPDASLDAVHGMPQRLAHDIPGNPIVIPGYHPAAHFYAPDLLQYITYDYSRFAAAVRREIDLTPATDEFPSPVYRDSEELSRGQLDLYLDEIDAAPRMALDTEGVPDNVWSMQTSVAEGSALVLRRSTKSFAYFVPKLSAIIRRRNRKRRPLLVAMHNALYDIEMCCAVGLDLVELGVPLFDTMMAAYILCLEPQAMKNLARRWCGMVMEEYGEVVGKVGVEKQLAYLTKVMEDSWPAPEPRVEIENDGTSRLYKPQPVQRRAEAILLDVYSGKLDKEGRPTDPLKRWRKVDRELRRMVEGEMGPMPIGTLADVPLPRAVRYAGRDADATLRLVPRMSQALASAGLSDLMDMKMQMLPAAARMKMNGILGEKRRFEELSEDMWDRMDRLRARLSKQFCRGNPINPGSSDQIASLMRRRGLQGEKRTPTGKVSTSKKSIEHLRFKDPAIALVEDWREHQKIRDAFCEPVLENWPEGQDRVRIRCDLKITRVTSGRFSAALLDDVPSAPLLAIPVRHDLGKKVRSCYVADDGYEIGSWDLDQAEMRVMADESGDATLIKLFNEGKFDVHGLTASRIFGKPYEEVMAKENKMKWRYPAKRTGFGVITGIQPPGLLDQLRMAGCEGWDLNSVARLIREWFKMYPGVDHYMKWCREECRRQGGVIRDRWGMPRYLPAIFSNDKYLMLEAERQTHSHRIQGGAQGMLQKAIGILHPQLMKYGDAVRWVIQIHDSLMLEVADGLQDEISAMVINAMTKTTRLKVPVSASASFSTEWGKME